MMTAYLEITAIHFTTEVEAQFSGVFIRKSQPEMVSAKSYVLVRTRLDVMDFMPIEGQCVQITGYFKTEADIRGNYKLTRFDFMHPKRIKLVLPSASNEFVNFVSKERDFVGVGAAKAKELWRKFGSKIFTILESKQLNPLLEVLTPRSATAMITGYEKYHTLQYAEWFAEHGIPPFIQQKLFKWKGKSIVDEIKGNPYLLVTFGLKFKQADEIARTYFNVERHDKRRFVAAIEQSIRSHTAKGHTYMTKAELKKRLYDVMRDHALVDKAMSSNGHKLSFKYVPETGNYHAVGLYIMEALVAKRLVNLNRTKPKWGSREENMVSKAMSELPFLLTPKQTIAVKTSLGSRVCVITGGAGTGKTTILKTVLRAYESLQYNIYPMALSGRAAKRMHESILMQTSTIARFLKGEPITEGGKNLIVIDEASMLDLPTMYKIINHVHPSTRFLLVGDPNQLPSIGAGLVLSDIIDSEVIPVVKLDVVKRQAESSGIPEYSADIIEGRMPLELTTGCIHFHDVEAEGIVDKCTELYAASPDDSQIVSSTKVITQKLNEACQSAVNADGEPMYMYMFSDDKLETDFRLGDPVIFTVNNYKVGVQNGTLGHLTEIKTSGNTHGVVKTDSGDNVELTRQLFDSLRRSYSITLHKAQGSQFKRTIVALDSSPLVDRSWFYTGITRTENELHIVGSLENFKRAVANTGARNKRKTYLSQLLQQELAKVA